MVKTQKKDIQASPSTPGESKDVNQSSKKIQKAPKSSCMKETTTMFTEFQQQQEEDYETAHDQVFLKIFLNSKDDDSEMVDKREFMNQIKSNGILKDDPRIKEMFDSLDLIDEVKLSKDQFFSVIKNNFSIVEKSLSENFVIPEF